jgi:hypothetical protein
MECMQDGHVFVYKSVMRLFGGGYQQILIE